MTDRILVNGMITPDGTRLFSRSRHDYRTHKDENGETYMVDGGTDYLRRSVNKEPATDISVYATGEFQHDRNHAHWGSFDPDTDEGPNYRPIASLTTDHIRNILEDCPYADPFLRDLMEQELKWRDSLE